MPTPASYEDTILSAALTVLQNVVWATQGTVTMLAANVQRRLLPYVEEQLTALPCVILAAGGPESEEVVSFEGEKDVVYAVEIAIVAAGNADFATYEPLYEAWREQAKRAFGSALLAGAPTVWDTRVQPGAIFDHSLLNQQYVYQSITVRFTSHEPRT